MGTFVVFIGLLFIYNAVSEVVEGVSCDCAPCTRQDCGCTGGESLTYCIANTTSNACKDGCLYIPAADSISTSICVNQPLPPPRLCGCEFCTNETCGVEWKSLAYCPLVIGDGPQPAECAVTCFLHIDSRFPTGICVNQLLPDPEPLVCGVDSCPTSSCGKTTCNDKGCVQECYEGCCYSNDAEICQPCTGAGDLVYQEPSSIFGSVANAELLGIVSLSVLIPVVVILLIIIIVLVRRNKSEGGSYLQEPFIDRQ